MVAMPQKENRLLMTEEEYLDFEDKSETKHEYVNGEVLAMAGAGLRHNIISTNISTALNNQLVDKNCIVPSNDTKVKVQSKVNYRYPDVSVICGEPQFAENRIDTITNPIVLIEVVSPSTALTDYNDKLEEYMQIESLQEYIIIEQHEAKIKRYRRPESGEWRYTLVSGLEESIELPSIGVTLTLADVYRKVSFEEDEAE